jgi:hypothetical protein
MLRAKYTSGPPIEATPLEVLPAPGSPLRYELALRFLRSS